MNSKSPNNWKGKRAPDAWLPHSSDLTPCDFLTGHLKRKECCTAVDSIEQLKKEKEQRYLESERKLSEKYELKLDCVLALSEK